MTRWPRPRRRQPGNLIQTPNFHLPSRKSNLPKKDKPQSQRDRGYSNLFHHVTKHLKRIEQKLDTIMATQAEQTAKLTAIGDKLDKASAEILAAIQALKDAQANAGNTTPEEDAATARLETAAQSLDDIVPDAP
jgi:chromosome segregation ATPase